MVDDMPMVDLLYLTDPDEFFDSIVYSRFYERSPDSFMMTNKGKRQLLIYMLGEKQTSTQKKQKNILENTYFMWLPFELLLYIFELEAELEIHDDCLYNESIFDNSNRNLIILHQLRAIKKTNRPIRNVYQQNEAGKVVTKITNLINDCHSKKHSHLYQIQKLYDFTINHMLWVCLQSYDPHWKNYMNAFYHKIYEYIKTVNINIKSKTPISKRWHANTLLKCKDLLYKIFYFINEYIPYVLLSNPELKCMCVTDGRMIRNYFIEDLVYDIYCISAVHPNDIDVNKALEFEMSTYAPTYYQNTYLQYERDQKGVVLIPEGEKKPMFYWCAGKYIKRFI